MNWVIIKWVGSSSAPVAYFTSKELAEAYMRKYSPVFISGKPVYPAESVFVGAETLVLHPLPTRIPPVNPE